jgi:hypothetical protein
MLPTKPLAEMSRLERIAYLNDLDYSQDNVKRALLDAFHAGRLEQKMSPR